MDFRIKRVIRTTSFEDDARTRPALRSWLERSDHGSNGRQRSVWLLWSSCGGSKMDLAPDFDEFFALLTAHGVEVVIVGAYALAFHGAPRFTGDIDILVRPTLENGARLLAAIDAFGFPTETLRPEDIVDSRRLIEMGVEPVQIRVMTAISGVSWDEAWADHVDGPCGRHQLPYVGRETFLRNSDHRKSWHRRSCVARPTLKVTPRLRAAATGRP